MRMAVGLMCCLEKRRTKAVNYSVEAPLKSAGTSTRSHLDHLRHCSVGGLAQKEMKLLTC